MIITLVCDNEKSWIIPYLYDLQKKLIELTHEVIIINDYKKLRKGDCAFFLSCESIVNKEYLGLNSHNLVVHESDLPKGKGWSPLTWQVLEGKNEIPIVLFEASEKVDEGEIYFRDFIKLDGDELLTRIKDRQGKITQELVLKFVNLYPNIHAIKQSGEESFYLKRTPKDSELDIKKTIEEQFNLFRVVDNEQYPAFFTYNNKKYILKIYEE